MKNDRHTRGFTMMELMATIALLAIVAGLAFVSVAQYQRNAYQREMDETAKEIYIAAQNHLTVADSMGTLSKKTQGTTDADNENTYYYIVPSSSASLSNSKSMLYTMLPPMSIDAGVRSSGSYIIRYQYVSGSPARVLDVFYADPSGRYGYTFGTEDYATLFDDDSSYRSSGDAGKEARSSYDDGNAIIGYYGGDGLSTDTSTLSVPKLEIHNAEKLYARLTNPGDFSGYSFEFYAVGETSGAISEAITVTATEATGKTYIDAVFDSITESDCHFADLETTSGTFIPGENIKIQVFAIDSENLKVAKSAKYRTNSLFASVSSMSVSNLIKAFLGTTDDSSSDVVATISNIRHLENLSNAISGYDPTNTNFTNAPTSYEQAVDLSWPDFCDGIATLNSVDASTIQVYSLDDSASTAYCFTPIDWSFSSKTLVYKGNARRITGVEIDASGDAGLFGTLTNGNVTDLELVDFTVTSTGGNAGALAGEMSSTSATNVLAHNENDSSDLVISASGSAGGLVGSMTGGTMKGCAAAVYVKGSSVVGGLIGSASGIALQYSYAGGHTNKGGYEDPYNSNVSSDGVAGGLVGSLASGSTVSSCYSTCSVSGGTAGILVGSNSGTVASDCYALGAVNDSAWEITDVSGSSLSASELDALAAGTSGSSAAPYDATLTSKYNGKYPFRIIAEFSGASSDTDLKLTSTSGATLTKHLTTHYGDWPAIVTLVVNS